MGRGRDGWEEWVGVRRWQEVNVCGRREESGGIECLHTGTHGHTNADCHRHSVEQRASEERRSLSALIDRHRRRADTDNAVIRRGLAHSMTSTAAAALTLQGCTMDRAITRNDEDRRRDHPTTEHYIEHCRAVHTNVQLVFQLLLLLPEVPRL